MADTNAVVRVNIHYTLPNASDIMNVFHFRLLGGSMDNSLLASALEGWVESIWGDVWKALAVGACQLDRWEADVVNLDGTVAETIGSGSINLDGTVTGDALPAGNAAYMLAYTAVPKARGSKYIPGLGDNNVADGVLNAGGLVALANALLVFLADVSLGGGLSLTPGVLSKALGVFLAFQNSGLVDDRPAYQRRRKRGVGA